MIISWLQYVSFIATHFFSFALGTQVLRHMYLVHNEY